jgi:anti-anti-sigma factor
MEISITNEQGHVPVTVFHITGEIDVKTYEQLEQRAQQEYKAGMRNLLLDLSGVTFLSSAGLRAIHGLFLLLRSDTAEESDEAISRGLRDGTFKSYHLMLLNPQPQVLQSLSYAGFDMYLHIHHDLHKAVESFGMLTQAEKR